jgi:DivIVA domain-containing protein
VDLSPRSITGREFELNRRGYDPDAVDSHLKEIADAVAAQTNRMSEMETVVASLQAKVQDANESEEALRLTLKAAAHAKEELLAGAREQVKTMEGEAASKAATVVGDAEAKAKELTDGAVAQAAAITQGASVQARDVAKAALAETELLVARIEALRHQLTSAEDALSTLSSEASPNVDAARQALDHALAQARETVENPALLESAAAPTPEPAAVPAPEEPVALPLVAEAPAEGGAPEVLMPEAEATEPPAAPPAAAVPVAPEQPEESAEPVEEIPHLEVVATAESTAEISDKVDRLLEELREVT